MGSPPPPPPGPGTPGYRQSPLQTIHEQGPPAPTPVQVISPPTTVPTAPTMATVHETYIGSGHYNLKVGGKPKADWTGLDPNHQSKENPMRYRPLNVTKDKCITERQSPIKRKFTLNTTNVLDILIDLEERAKAIGVDTYLYLLNPSNDQEMLSITREYPKFIADLETTKTIANKIRSKFDQNDRSEDSTLFAIIKGSTAQPVLDKLQFKVDEDCTAAFYLMQVVHCIVKSSPTFYDGLKTKLKSLEPKMYSGENVEAMGLDAVKLISILKSANRLTIDDFQVFLSNFAKVSKREGLYNHKLLTLIGQVNDEVKKCTHMTSDDAWKHMTGKDLDPPTIIDKVSEWYTEEINGNTWPAAKLPTASHSPNQAFANVASMDDSAKMGVVNKVMALLNLNPSAMERGIANGGSRGGSNGSSRSKSKPAGGKGNCHNCGSDQHWAADCPNKGTGDASSKKGNDTKVKSWRTTPPASGASESVSRNGRTFYWCAKCKRWTASHGTSGHTGKSGAKKGGSDASKAHLLSVDPGAWCAFIDPTSSDEAPNITSPTRKYCAKRRSKGHKKRLKEALLGTKKGVCKTNKSKTKSQHRPKRSYGKSKGFYQSKKDKELKFKMNAFKSEFQHTWNPKKVSSSKKTRHVVGEKHPKSKSSIFNLLGIGLIGLLFVGTFLLFGLKQLELFKCAAGNLLSLATDQVVSTRDWIYAAAATSFDWVSAVSMTSFAYATDSYHESLLPVYNFALNHVRENLHEIYLPGSIGPLSWFLVGFGVAIALSRTPPAKPASRNERRYYKKHFRHWKKKNARFRRNYNGSSRTSGLHRSYPLRLRNQGVFRTKAPTHRQRELHSILHNFVTLFDHHFLGVLGKRHNRHVKSKCGHRRGTKSNPASKPTGDPKFEKFSRYHRRRKNRRNFGNGRYAKPTVHPCACPKPEHHHCDCNLPFKLHNKVNHGWRGDYYLHDPHNVPSHLSPEQVDAIEAIAKEVNLTSLPDLLNHSSDIPKILKAAHSAPGRFRNVLGKADQFPVIWDSGASVTIKDFVKGTLTHSKVSSVNGIGSGLDIQGEGLIEWVIQDDHGNLRTIRVKAYYAPGSKIRLLSTTDFLKHYRGENLLVEAHQMVLSGVAGDPERGPITIRIHPHSNLPMSIAYRNVERHIPSVLLNTISTVHESNLNLSEPQKELLRWHYCLGHVDIRRVQFVMKTGVLATSPGMRRLHERASVLRPAPKCAACQFGKQVRRTTRGKRTSAVPSGKIANNILYPGQEVSVDHFVCSTKGRLWTSRGQTSDKDMYHGGALFVDQASKYVHVEPQVSLSTHATIHAKLNFEKFCSDIGVIVQKYITDGGSCFTSKDFAKHLSVFRQIIRFAGAGAHHHCPAEREIRTIMSIARTMMLHASIHWPELSEPELWPMAVKYAEFTWNHLPDVRTGLSPAEVFTKTKWSNHNFQNFHVWGCPVYVLDKDISDGKKIPKWRPRSQRMMFVGFSPDHASCVPMCLNPQTGTITPQFHVVFDDWFQTVATNVEDLPDFNSVEWRKLFVEILNFSMLWMRRMTILMILSLQHPIHFIIIAMLLCRNVQLRLFQLRSLWMFNLHLLSLLQHHLHIHSLLLLLCLLMVPCRWDGRIPPLLVLNSSILKEIFSLLKLRLRGDYHQMTLMLDQLGLFREATCLQTFLAHSFRLVMFLHLPFRGSNLSLRGSVLLPNHLGGSTLVRMMVLRITVILILRLFQSRIQSRTLFHLQHQAHLQ